jgi:nicotinamidase-related amidase
MSALIICDMQYDFCNGGPMANYNSLDIIPKINVIRDNYQLIIFIIKTYPKNHVIFTDCQEHCIINSDGSKICKDIIFNKNIDIIIPICTKVNYLSNSGFFDDENLNMGTKLNYYLQLNNIKKLYFCGNSFETTIFSTIIDAMNHRYSCYILRHIIGYKDKVKHEKKKEFLLSIGVLYA